MERVNRDPDGIYTRVQRDGKWQNVCLSDLTAEELEQALDGKSIVGK